MLVDAAGLIGIHEYLPARGRDKLMANGVSVCGGSFTLTVDSQLSLVSVNTVMKVKRLNLLNSVGLDEGLVEVFFLKSVKGAFKVDPVMNTPPLGPQIQF